MQARTLAKTLALVSTVILAAQSDTAAASDPTEAIQVIFETDRKAHLTGDASLLVANLDATVVEVSRGAKQVRSRDEIESFFRQTFDTVDYSTWDDVEPPTIRISADGTMAWVIRSIYAELEVVGTDERPARSVDFTSVFTSTYEMRDGKWMMTSVTSTFLPAPQETQPE